MTVQQSQDLRHTECHHHHHHEHFQYNLWLEVCDGIASFFLTMLIYAIQFTDNNVPLNFIFHLLLHLHSTLTSNCISNCSFLVTIIDAFSRQTVGQAFVAQFFFSLLKFLPWALRYRRRSTNCLDRVMFVCSLIFEWWIHSPVFIIKFSFIIFGRNLLVRKVNMAIFFANLNLIFQWPLRASFALKDL